MAKIIFELTNLCNFSCVYCLREETGAKDYLDPSVIDKVLDEAGAYLDIHLVAFTGGEPTLHPRFEDLVRSVAERKLPLAFVTNGWQFEKTFRKLEPYKQQVRNINFSLDGAHEATHDRLRGREGSYRRIMKAISLCRFHGIPVHINMVVTTANRGELEDMAVLASRLGCEALGYGHCQPTPDGSDAELVPSFEDRRRIEAEVAALGEIFQLDISLAGDHYSSSRFHQCSQLKMKEFNVDYRGYLTACCMLSNYRGGKPDTDVLADLNRVSFGEAHSSMVQQFARLNQEKIARAAAESSLEDHFICTHCFEHYEKRSPASAEPPSLVQIGAR